MDGVPAGVRVLPRLLLNLLSTLRLAELGLEAHVPRSEARGAVVISALAVVLGELVRRCCADGRRTLWNRMRHTGRWVAGASAHSSSTLAHLASSSTYAPTSRGGLVRPTSSCAPRLARRVRRSTRSPKRLPFRREKSPEGGVFKFAKPVRRWASSFVELHLLWCRLWDETTKSSQAFERASCSCHAALAYHCEPGSVDGTAGHRAGSAASSAGDARVRWRRCCANRWASHGGLLHGGAGRVALHLVR